MSAAEFVPVVVSTGEAIDRPERVEDALEPVALMERALRQADGEAGGGVLQRLQSVQVIGQVTWRYVDPVNLLCDRLCISPANRVNAGTGGDTPIRLIHEAAVRIAKGELTSAAIVGGEAMSAMNHARRSREKLDWTPLASKEAALKSRSDRIEISGISKQLGVTLPMHLYPLYEMAAQSAWRQTPKEGQVESAALWARYASVAAKNPFAWIREAPSAEQIEKVSSENRVIAWPYTKLMVANPSVNQAAATIVMSVAAARAAGITEDRFMYIWGGAAAAEAADYLKRDRFDHSAAQAASLAGAVEIVGGDAKRFDKLELYSCFPVVPKMALRQLGLDPLVHSPTVTGGLTFFGGPLHNYMNHAVAAMARAIRTEPNSIGLLYGQGGFFTKHHCLVVSGMPPPKPMALNYSVQSHADVARGPVPPVVEQYDGAANVETYTVLHGRDGDPLHGFVVLRTPEGERTLARVTKDDEESLAILTSRDRSAVGSAGRVSHDVFGKPVWQVNLRATAARLCRFVTVERDASVTIVTINRPEALNALHPEANAELARIFDEFANDEAQWVAILTGAGDRAFSSGNDLRYAAAALARGEELEIPLSGFGGLTSRFDLHKPVIAAVNGVAMGGGFEIALACDLIVAAETAEFALPEPKVGRVALTGGLLRLPREIGMKQAMGMILTGRRVSAREGLQLGFVNEVTAPKELLAVARRWAQQILECSPMAIRASKQIVSQGVEEPSLPQAYLSQTKYSNVTALFRSADFREGPMAFAQKRKPRWEGQ